MAPRKMLCLEFAPIMQIWSESWKLDPYTPHSIFPTETQRTHCLHQHMFIIPGNSYSERFMLQNNLIVHSRSFLEELSSIKTSSDSFYPRLFEFLPTNSSSCCVHPSQTIASWPLINPDQNPTWKDLAYLRLWSLNKYPPSPFSSLLTSLSLL